MAWCSTALCQGVPFLFNPTTCPQPTDVLSDELLRACIHCGMCLPACPTYAVTGNEAESPRGRLYLMQQHQKGQLAPTALKPHLDACLGCVACQNVCPSGVQYGAILTRHRAVLAKYVPWHLRQFKRFMFKQVLPRPKVLSALTHPGRWFQQRVMQPHSSNTAYQWVQNQVNSVPALQWQWQLLPPIPNQASPFKAGQTFGNPAHPTVALMTGCMMDTLYHPVHQATIEVLVANQYHVVIPPQTCCGALAMHAGEADIAQQLAQQNVDLIPSNVDHIVLNSAGCGAAMAEYGHWLPADKRAEALANKVIDVMALLARKPLAPFKRGIPHAVTYHGACHLHHAQRITTEPVHVLQQIPDIELIPLPAFDTCCGSAGIYNVEQPEMSQALLADKMAMIAMTEADVVLAGNPGCLVQIQAGLAQLKRPENKPPVLLCHPIELLAHAYGNYTLPLSPKATPTTDNPKAEGPLI
jgi:glycolate oxidase iron-sulfur subunit